MTVKEIKEAMENDAVLFGVKQALKNGKKSKRIFVVKDARKETFKALESAKLPFILLKSKEDLSKELNLNFKCEVFSLN